MLKLVVLQTSGQESAESINEVEIMPQSEGLFSDATYLPGVHIINASTDQEKATLMFIMETGSDCWLGGVEPGSLVNLALDQIASQLDENSRLPRALATRVVFTDFIVPVDSETVNFSVMRKTKSGWNKVSNIQVSNFSAGQSFLS